MSSDGSAVILLVEDNPAHALLVKRTLGRSLACRIFHVADGEDALDYLFRRGAYADAEKSPIPHLILLDLRLPKIEGLDVLQKVKSASGVSEIPVVVLTTSDLEKNVATAYERQANGYLVKPIDFEEFGRMMKALSAYWLGWNRLSPAITKDG